MASYFTSEVVLLQHFLVILQLFWDNSRSFLSSSLETARAVAIMDMCTNPNTEIGFLMGINFLIYMCN